MTITTRIILDRLADTIRQRLRDPECDDRTLLEQVKQAAALAEAELPKPEAA